MKKLTLPLLVLAAFIGAGATTFTIHLYTDFPNSTPVSSDFLLFQRNNNFISSAQSQYLPTWFNNPVFTGNGSINGAFNIGGTLTVGGAVITGVTFYGDGSGLSNVATQVYFKNLNDNGTNETFWTTTFNGVSTFQEIDAELAYFTNLFTFLTNAQYTATDGDGKLIAGTGLPATNILLSAGANIAFTTNGSGGIEIASTGTNTVDVSTNNLIVVTNVIVYSNLTVIQNIYISTNFSTNFYSSISFITNLYSSTAFITNLYSDTNFVTNLFFVSGKGNTLIITNNLQLLYLTASKLVATDSAKSITNADITTDLSFSGNVLGIAAGAKPTLNLYNSTNLNISAIVSPTNGVNSASAVDFSVPEATTNIAGAVSFTSLSNFNQTNYNHAIRYLINRTGSDQTITVGSWETDSARTSATTYTCTNNTTLALMFSAQINFFTNVVAYKTFR